MSIEPSFGMPSGHAQYAISIWGMIAHFFRRPWAYALAIWPEPAHWSLPRLLGRPLSGGCDRGLGFGCSAPRSFPNRRAFCMQMAERLDLKRQILVSFLASLGIIALLVMGWVAMGSWQTPSAWAANALEAANNPIDPLKPQEVNAAGLLFGIAAGYAILLKRGNFLANGPAAQRLMRYLLGMAGVILIWYGIGALIQGLPGGYANAYLHTMLLGLWVTIGAPLLFAKLKLAEIRKGPS